MGEYSEFQVTGMIEWGQKSKPRKVSRASNKTKKIPGSKINPQKSHAELPNVKIFQRALNDITRKMKFFKTGLVVLYSQNCEAKICGHYHWIFRLFWILKKSLLKSSHPPKTYQNFLPKTIPWSKKNLRLSQSLENRSTPHGNIIPACTCL